MAELDKKERHGENSRGDNGQGISLERGSERFPWRDLLLMLGGTITGGVIGGLAVAYGGELLLGIPALTTLNPVSDNMFKFNPLWLKLSTYAGIGIGMAEGLHVVAKALRLR